MFNFKKNREESSMIKIAKNPPLKSFQLFAKMLADKMGITQQEGINIIMEMGLIAISNKTMDCDSLAQLTRMMKDAGYTEFGDDYVI